MTVYKSILASPAVRIDRSSRLPPGAKGLTDEERVFNQSFYDTVLKQEELKNRGRQHINAETTTCVFSTPRGGSTWMGEILSEIPNSVLCNEPLFRLQEFSELGFTWHQPIPPNTDWPEAREVFRKLLNREILKYCIYSQSDLTLIPGADHHIFKFCHGNMLLEWFTDQFPVKPVLLVRHPCAVVSSQLHHHGWDYLKKEKSFTYYIPEFRFNESYFLYEDVLKTVKTSEENLAATWCLTMINSLKSQSNDLKWITVSYENLYANFEYEINRIFGRLGRAIPSTVYERERKLSKSAIGSSGEYVKSGAQLNSWKTKLTARQQNNIMAIVKEFGLDHYTLDPSPDLGKMYKSL